MIALLPPAYLPDDPRIVLVGRFDRTDPAAPACAWPGSEVRLRVRGATLVATIEEAGRDLWQVVVDGKPVSVLTPIAGTADYSLSLGADGVHDVSLVKRTEGFVGTTRFRGFDVPGGGLFQARRHAKLIEFVGDSITCGYGVEGRSERDHFAVETENAWAGYAGVAARALDADARLLAASGRKMWPDRTMPEIADRLLPDAPAPLADATERPADAFVVNLGTNDFNPSTPSEAPWSAAYEAFVRRLWARNPAAPVYVTFGGMLKDDWPVGHKALSTARSYLTRLVARVHDPRLHLLEFPQQSPADGFGADGHPSLVTQRKMGLRLAEAMRKDLGW